MGKPTPEDAGKTEAGEVKMGKVGARWGRGTSEEFQGGMWERVLSPATRGGLESQRWSFPLQTVLGMAPLKPDTADQLSKDWLTRFAPLICL